MIGVTSIDRPKAPKQTQSPSIAMWGDVCLFEANVFDNCYLSEYSFFFSLASRIKAIFDTPIIYPRGWRQSGKSSSMAARWLNVCLTNWFEGARGWNADDNGHIIVTRCRRGMLSDKYILFIIKTCKLLLYINLFKLEIVFNLKICIRSYESSFTPS
jgi:hypothetical protein